MGFKNEKILSFARRLLVTIGILIVFTILSFYPNFSYFAELRLISAESTFLTGYLKVYADCNMTFNPFLHTFSWLTGNGYFSGNFSFISKPIYHTWGEGLRIEHRSFPDLEEEAVEHIALRQIRINVLYNFILFFIVGLLNWQDLYLSMIAGAIGFSIGGLTAAFAAFVPALAILAIINVRLGEGVLVRTWNFLSEKQEKPRELGKLTSEH